MNANIISVAFGTGGGEIMQVLHDREEFRDIKNFNIAKYAQSKNPKGVLLGLKDFLTYLENERPDIVVNERSNGVSEHKIIEKKCIELGIHTICLLDVELGTGRFDELPDYILCPSRDIEQELLENNFKQEQIYVCGNPAFDKLKETGYTREVNTETPTILYASQGVNTRMIKKLVEQLDETFTDYNLHIKLHPQVDEFRFLDIRNLPRVRILGHDARNDFIPECLNYDLILGKGSTIQLKTVIMGVPTIFMKDSKSFMGTLQQYKTNPELFQTDTFGYEDHAADKTIDTILNKITPLILKSRNEMA